MATAALTGALALTGCGGDDAAPPASAHGTSAAASTTPGASTSEEGATSSSPPTAGASGSALPEDWTPEEPTVLATGQKVPDDYEPATLEHPARNVPKPVMPAEAKKETEAGAQAFLNYRADAQWYSIQTGDTSLIREVTSTDCTKCTEQYDYFDRIYEQGHWAAGGFETEKLLDESFIRRPEGGYNVPVAINSRGMIVIKDGKVSDRQESFNYDGRFDSYLYYENNSWFYLTASPRGSL
ncbi:DUF6318 family protein [Kocuria sp.]|uniref:DUF6318 family protein n=1 Tax=Kocuria sp. TaxID=1871328 RepID=UPI0026DD85CE|nr:DUF6318 family protein [Kocuria sp.]MDO4918550.1 DUF6318 family protein [Kocuria sp.]